MVAKSLKAEEDDEPQSDGNPRFAEPRGMIVPDHTGTTVIAFYHERGESRVEEYPVIAWRVRSDVPEPVTIEDINTPVYCLKLSTGLWIFPADTSFSSEEKAQEYGKSRAKLRRENE